MSARAAHLTTRRARESAYREAGRCHCGRPAAPGRTRCQPCLDSAKRYHARRCRPRLAARRALGLCVLCTAPNEALPGSPFCAYHREKKTETENARRAARKAAKACPLCGGERDLPARIYCQACRKARAAITRRRRARLGGRAA